MDCSFVARGATEDDVLSQAVAHAENDHGITDLSPELVTKVKAAIHEE
jgi:predicted small metal-binding protein